MKYTNTEITKFLEAEIDYNFETRNDCKQLIITCKKLRHDKRCQEKAVNILRTIKEKNPTYL